jgi:hypothetical protein
MHVQLSTFIHNSDLRKFQLAPEIRKLSSSITSATVSTVTKTPGEKSEDGQNLEPPNRGFMVLTDCLSYMELGFFGKYMLHGVNRDTTVQNCTLYGVNKGLCVTRMHALLLLGNL